MDRKELARKLREALFDHIETERRDALQDGAVDDLFEKVLAVHDGAQSVTRPAWLYTDTAPTIIQLSGGDVTDWSLTNAGSVVLTT